MTATKKTYKSQDGTWDRSAIMARGHEIAQSDDSGRSYNAKLSDGMKQAWNEAKQVKRVEYTSGSLKNTDTPTDSSESRETVEYTRSGCDVLLFWAEDGWTLRVDGLYEDQVEYEAETKRKAEEIIDYAFRIHEHADTEMQLFQLIYFAFDAGESAYKTTKIAHGKMRRDVRTRESFFPNWAFN